MMTGKLTAGNDLLATAGNSINVLQGSDQKSVETYTSEVKVGISLKLEQNLTSNAKKAYDNTMKTAQAQDVLSGINSGVTAVNSAMGTLDSSASASLTVGASSKGSSSSSHSNTAVLPELFAGNDLTLAAGKDITLEGAQMLAGNDMLLAAGRDLNIHAAVNTGSQKQESHSASAGAGIGASASMKNGTAAGYRAEAEFANSGQKGDSLTYTNAKLAAGGTLTTVSGQDTSIVGGNLTAKDVDMTVGRDLLVSSLQDHSSASGHSTKLGGSVTMGFGASVDVQSQGDTAKGSLGIKNNDSSSHRVNDQTSILGSNSVNIYTENNTHVAGAVIAALNDNLKLDTGSLTYENLIGKSKSTSIGWGVNWKKSFGEKKGESKEPVKEGDSSGKTGGTEQYETPKQLQAIKDLQKKMTDKWGEMKKDAQFAPAAFEYQYKETTQTAHATIGNGEIIIRNNPNASLDGLNRDVSNAVTEKNTANVNIKLDPLFEYVDAATTVKNIPNTTDEGLKFLYDPGTYIKNAWKDFKKNLPWNTEKNTDATTAAPAPQTSQAAQGEK